MGNIAEIGNQIYVFPMACVITREIDGLVHYLTQKIMLSADVKEAKLFDAESASETLWALDVLYGVGVFEIQIVQTAWRLQ